MDREEFNPDQLAADDINERVDARHDPEALVADGYEPQDIVISSGDASARSADDNPTKQIPTDEILPTSESEGASSDQSETGQPTGDKNTATGTDAENTVTKTDEDWTRQYASSDGMGACASRLRDTEDDPTINPYNLDAVFDPVEMSLKETFRKQMMDYEGAPVVQSEEFRLKWTTFEHELETYIAKPEFIPHDSVSSTGLDKNSFQDCKQCAEALQDSLYEEDILRSLGNLRGFRRLFSSSDDHLLRNAFRGKPTEVLQNIYYGGSGILPEERMKLGDPFHHSINNEMLD